MSDMSLPARAQARLARPGRVRGVLFASVWLFFLIEPARDAWALLGGVAGWLALAALVAFAVCFLMLFLIDSRPGAVTRRGVTYLVALCLCAAVLFWALGQEGTAVLPYLAVAAMEALPLRAGIAAVVLLAVGNDVAGRVVPGWQEDASLTMAVAAVGFAMWGVQQMIARNRELILTKEQNARLAVADERNRFARDLHDVLGHSLTVVTVKAELASRLMDADPERARAEVADIERLSRDALAEVRQVVTGYRQPSLSGELARARQALDAAGIAADLPNSTDAVPSALREVFAWTIREGITNVVRHSGARNCRVVLDADEVQVVDDGRGSGGADFGNGLTGLRERAAAAGAVLTTEALTPGFSLRVVARG